MARDGRLTRLERASAGEVIRIEQIDGTTRTFPLGDFWTELFTSAVAGATGERADSPVATALANATPEARAKIDRLVARDGGDFLAGWTVDQLDTGGEPIPDLSE